MLPIQRNKFQLKSSIQAIQLAKWLTKLPRTASHKIKLPTSEDGGERPSKLGAKSLTRAARKNLVSRRHVCSATAEGAPLYVHIDHALFSLNNPTQNSCVSLTLIAIKHILACSLFSLPWSEVCQSVCSWRRGVGQHTLRVAIVRRNSSYVKWICNAIRECDTSVCF